MSEQVPQDPSAEQLATQLTRIERLLAIGFAGQIEERRKEVGVDDAVTAAILTNTSGWTAAGVLKQASMRASGQSEPTVKRRLNRLVELGALERRGQGPSTEYRTTARLG
jgi:hypothetical protein